MKVQLGKTTERKNKITNAVVKQCLWPNLEELKSFNVIGNCVHNGIRYILLYDEHTCNLRKYPLNSDISCHTEPYNYVLVNFGRNFRQIEYKTESVCDTIYTASILNKVKEQSISNGQIFL